MMMMMVVVAVVVVVVVMMMTICPSVEKVYKLKILKYAGIKVRNKRINIKRTTLRIYVSRISKFCIWNKFQKNF
jgi:hypothetical protein